MKMTLDKIHSSLKIQSDECGLLEDMIKKIMPAVMRGGLFMEFGVWQGSSIRRIIQAMRNAGIYSSCIYGFDSFMGIPEQWGSMPAGFFNLDGKIPDFQDKGITIIPGWFNEVLPNFLNTNKDFASFIHIDCDVYSSAKYILNALQSRIVPGTILLFDEMINVPDYDLHEFKAFNEFLNEFNKEAQCLCHGKYQVAFRIKK